MALLARMARIPFVAATSVDYPGSLLDVRHQRPPGMRSRPRWTWRGRPAAGFRPVTTAGSASETVPRDRLPMPIKPYVVVHPGLGAVPGADRRARRGASSRRCRAAGWPVVVTGGPAERDLAGQAAGVTGIDLSGRTDLAGLAAVLAGAACVVVGNTGPAHLAAAVGTPVVSLFSPVVPGGSLAPVRGADGAAGRPARRPAGTPGPGSCPLPGHPCLSQVSAAEVVHGRRHPGRRPRSRGRAHEGADLARARLLDDLVRLRPRRVPGARAARSRPGRPRPGPDLELAGRCSGAGPGRRLRDTVFDVVVLQRPQEIELLHRWTGLRAGIDVPAVYVEHNTPAESAARQPAPAGRPGRHHGRPRHRLQRG